MRCASLRAFLPLAIACTFVAAKPSLRVRPDLTRPLRPRCTACSFVAAPCLSAARSSERRRDCRPRCTACSRVAAPSAAEASAIAADADAADDQEDAVREAGEILQRTKAEWIAEQLRLPEEEQKAVIDAKKARRAASTRAGRLARM